MNQVIKSLSEVYQDYFKMGAAVNLNTLHSQQELLKKHFNSITCENEMKFQNIHPSESIFTFEKADQIIDFASKNNKQLRGHTLVWHNQNPNWLFIDHFGNLVNKDVLYSRLKHHMYQIMTRYKQHIYAWDVVNEAISDNDTELYRSTKWLDICGEEYIEKAFTFAHEINPHAPLFYNDYNTTNPQKREKIYTLVKNLLQKGVPIHGIGMQGHWNIETPSIKDIRNTLDLFSSLNIKIQITELDLSVFTWDDRRTHLTKPEPEMLVKQTKRYEEIFELFREYYNVIDSVTFWGAADDYTWLNNFPVKGRKNWPFVFDEHHLPKESFWKIINFS